MTIRRRLSKRAFLQASGAAAVTLGLPGATRAAVGGRNWDLIVVGGGNAGLPTAIFAAQRGARVLVVEAGPVVGGTLFLSSGQMSAAGTKLQKSKGIEDSPQIHYDDVMRISGGTADPTVLRLAVTNAAPVFDWLTDHGLEVLPEHPVTGTTHEPYSRPRYAWSREGGQAILKVLNAQLAPEIQSGRVVVRTSTSVTALIQDPDGSVRGVVTRNAAGEVEREFARSTALTCGGYTYEPAMYLKLEGAKDYARATYPFSRGAGINLGVAAGGHVTGGEYHTPLFGAVLADAETPSTIRAMVRHFPLDRPPFEIFVNVAGKRFLCEDVPSHNAYEQSLRMQPEERCWVVFDEAIYRAAPQLVRSGFGARWTPEDTAKAWNTVPMFFRADTLAGLARAARVDAPGLEATVADYNRGQASGRDALGRKHMPLPIAQPPFYAVQLQSWALLSYAGLAVDARLRVTRADGTPVPNLYAAGELLGMGQINGRSACGGMSVTPALALGRLLGHEILPVGA